MTYDDIYTLYILFRDYKKWIHLRDDLFIYVARAAVKSRGGLYRRRRDSGDDPGEAPGPLLVRFGQRGSIETLILLLFLPIWARSAWFSRFTAFETAEPWTQVVNHGILSAVHQEMSSIPHLEKPPMAPGQTREAEALFIDLHGLF